MRKEYAYIEQKRFRGSTEVRDAYIRDTELWIYRVTLNLYIGASQPLIILNATCHFVMQHWLDPISYPIRNFLSLWLKKKNEWKTYFFSSTLTTTIIF